MNSLPSRFGLSLVLVLTLPGTRLIFGADQNADLQAILGREIIGPHQTISEVQTYVEAGVPRMQRYDTAADWERQAERLRAGVLDRVVFRGKAADWRKGEVQVEWLDTIPGGPGYRIKKLRYEALPGLWIPALLYEPEKLAGRVPAILNVNGHDRNGKAAPYKQIRCINQAKRGMLALNVEWLGMGQLRSEGYDHGRMNQLDLCGTSGLAPFYLCMQRGLDVLLGLPHTDPERVAVTGLSGGGWQTIFISSLDTRVKLTDPVAGYSSLLTRVRHFKDLGDSEQTPTDLATVADYTHLTAMMAPRPTLLTYNSKDDCCFEAGYALPPLLEAARPIFRLYGKEDALRSHVNDDPGTHNYEKDNRQALYRMLGSFFFASDRHFDAKEIPSEKEVKSSEALSVPLPTTNADFHTLALAISRDLPHVPELPHDQAAAKEWQAARRQQLREVVRAKDYTVQAASSSSENKAGLEAIYWRLNLGGKWTLPAVELLRGQPQGTVIVLNDAGRRSDSQTVARLLAAGHRVLALDLFYFGEAKVEQHDYLFALLLAAIGDRPLGLQASQLAAVARWLRTERRAGPVTVVAVGPRLSTVALVAAALEEKAIAKLELQGSLSSLKEVIKQNRSVEQMPELFCFGLLETLDIKQLTALAAPRPVRAGDHVMSEFADLRQWYKVLGGNWDAPAEAEGAGTALEAVPKRLAPFFRPPPELERQFGTYKSPLVFNDGSPVRNPADWQKRRQEILQTWHAYLGTWPALIDRPRIEYLEKERRDKLTRHRIRLEIAPGRTTEDAYLLVPDGQRPFPAVLVVFYDAKTGVGQGKPLLDFAYQLAKRGFVTLSLGSPPATYYPDKAKAALQPLSFHAYVAANCYNALASLPAVDARRVGVLGHSYGGKWAMFASCLCEKFACSVWSDPGIVFDEARSNVNYWEPWYLGYQPDYERSPGIPSKDNPRTGAYKQLVEAGHDLHELQVLMAPRPFLVSGGSEDRPERWQALNHSIAVNGLLGYTHRVAMTNRKGHAPTPESNEEIYLFLAHFLRAGKILQ